MPKIQWDSNPHCPDSLRLTGYGKPLAFLNLKKKKKKERNLFLFIYLFYFLFFFFGGGGGGGGGGKQWARVSELF